MFFRKFFITVLIVGVCVLVGPIQVFGLDIDVQLNKSNPYYPGDRMEVSLVINNEGETPVVDLYVGVETLGSLYYLPTFTTSMIYYANNITIPDPLDLSHVIFAFDISEDFPARTMKWCAAFTKPGTIDIITIDDNEYAYIETSPTATPGEDTPTAGPTDTPGGDTPTTGPTNTPGGDTPTTGPTDTPGGPTNTPGGDTPTAGPTDTPGGPTNTPGGDTPTAGPTDTPGGDTPTAGRTDTPTADPTNTPGGDTPTEVVDTATPSISPSSPSASPTTSPASPTTSPSTPTATTTGTPATSTATPATTTGTPATSTDTPVTTTGTPATSTNTPVTTTGTPATSTNTPGTPTLTPTPSMDFSFTASDCIEPGHDPVILSNPGEVTLEVGADCFTLDHNNVEYNCCATMQVRRDAYDWHIDFFEEETYPPPDGPCYCICPYDIHITQGGLEPGEYQVGLHNEDKTVTYFEETVIISPPGYSSSSTGCLEKVADAPETIEIYGDGNSIVCRHGRVIFNCCAAPGMYLLREGFQLDFVEKENLIEPCDCLCPYNLQGRIDNLSPGTYTVNLFNGESGALLATETVEISGFGFKAP